MIFQSDPGSAQETRHPRGDLNLFELRPGARRRGIPSSRALADAQSSSHTTEPDFDEQFMILPLLPLYYRQYLTNFWVLVTLFFGKFLSKEQLSIILVDRYMGKQSGVRSKFNFDTECRIQQNVVNIREGGRWTRGNNHQMLREQTKSVHPLIFVIHNNYVLQSNTLLDCLVVINVNSDICNCNCVFLQTQFIPNYQRPKVYKVSKNILML